MISSDDAVDGVDGRFRPATPQSESAETDLLRNARELLEIANVIVVGLDFDGRIILVNRTTERVTGWSRTEILGKNWFDVMLPPSARDRTRAFFQQWRDSSVKEFAHGDTRDNPIVTRSGKERLISWSNSPLTTGGKLIGALSLGVDVTERQRAVSALAASEARYRFLFESNPNPMWIYDAQTLGFLEVNRAATAHYGYSKEEFLAMSIVDIRPSEAVPQLLDYIASAGADPREAGVWRHRHKDGGLMDVEITSDGIEWRGRSARLILARDVTKELAADRVLERARDELERMVAERTAELTESNIRLAEAASARSAFLANVSHELRTPLNSIIGFAGVMLQGLSGALTDEQSKQLEMIQRSGKQLLGIIEDVLDLSRIDSGRASLTLEEVDARQTIDEVINYFRPRLLQARLDYTIVAQPLPRIRTDRARLSQILHGLLSNAVKFTSHGGSVRIDAMAEGGEVSIAVSDTGLGIAPEHLEDVFEPFHQLKGVGVAKASGTGLGLAIVKQLAGLLGGRIAVESELGSGSTFTVVIPVAGPVEPQP